MSENNRFFAKIFRNDQEVDLKGKKAGPFYDQDEGEIELGTLLDEVWRENTGGTQNLKRRL